LLLAVISVLMARPALLVCAPPSSTFPPVWALIFIAIGGEIFSLWRYSDLRNKVIRLCYLHYVQFRMEPRSAQHDLQIEK
jgi:tryptophan-rich sensory protein